MSVLLLGQRCMNQDNAFAQEHLKPLTSLRFMATLLVFVYHCEPTAAIGTAYALGHAGVGFFFLLSGFMLTYTYHSHFSGGLSRDNVRAFYVARIARIYPLHLVGMGLAIAVLWRFGGTFWDRSDGVTRELALAAQSSLIQSWFPNEKVYFGLNAPAWTISVEAFCYGLFPFLMGSLSRSFAKRSPRAILVAGFLPWLMLVAVVLVPHRIVVWTAYVAPPIRLVDFLVGMTAAIAFVRKREIGAWLPHATVFEVAAIATVVGAILVSPSVPEVLRYALFLMPLWTFVIWVFARNLSRGLRPGRPMRLLSLRVG
jgi:peptidoglycan/LPS O-acetylase OafA/YrhL